MAAVLATARWVRPRGAVGLERLAPILSVALLGNELTYQFYWFLAGGWSPTTAIMLQMCGLSILLLPGYFAMEEGRAKTFSGELLYFWGYGGAVQALLSPDLGASGFPSYRFFSFFISHGLILVSVTAAVAAGSIRISLRSLGKTLVATNIALIPIYFVNLALARLPPYVPGNYFVIAYPPPTGSPVDLFARVLGPSPRYIAGLELMGIAVFLLLWLPWPLVRRQSRRNPSVTNL